MFDSLRSGIANWIAPRTATLNQSVAEKQPATPVAVEKRDFDLKSEEAIRTFVFGLPSLAGVPVNNETILSVPPFFSAVRYVSEGIAMMNRKVKKIKKGGWQEDDRSHPIAVFMRSAPHPDYSWFDLFQALMINACMGNGYARIHWEPFTMRPKYLELIPQGMCSPEYINYELHYRISGVLNGKSVSTVIPSCDMIHIKGFHTNGIQGRNMAYLHQPTFGSAQASQQYTASVYGKSAHPSIAIKYSQPLDPNEVNDIEESVMARHSGAGKAGKPLILDDGMDVRYLQWSPQEVAHIDYANLTVRQASMITKVPYDILAGDSVGTYGSAVQKNQNLLVHCYGPWTQKIEEEFNKKLFWRSEFEEGKRIFVLDSDIFLRMDRKTEADMIALLVGSAIITPNEGRLKLGMKPIEGGDSLFTSVDNIPLENVSQIAMAKYLSATGEKIQGIQDGIIDKEPVPTPQTDKNVQQNAAK